jgi:hypothetical protein
MSSGKEFMFAFPQLPLSAHYVMFDLEGMPPQLDEIEKIYIWGMQVYGDKGSDFISAVAGFGIDGDSQGWFDFLNKANKIFNEYRNIPFVHWHHYVH